MTLIRQVWLVLLGVLLLVLVGAVVAHTLTERRSLQQQLQSRNDDDAKLLALALSQQQGDAARMRQVAAQRFGNGGYRHLRLTRDDSSVIFERQAPETPHLAPAWFVGMLPFYVRPGEAQVWDASRALGNLQVWGNSAGAQDALWAGSVRMAGWLTLLGLVAAGLAWLVLRSWRAPLDATVAHAQALEERRFVVAPEPRVPELRRLTRSMNSLVRRLQALFEQQAAALDELRLQALSDVITGLPRRRHFVALLDAALRAENQRGAGLVLVRLKQLEVMNRRLGHEATDRLLAALAQVLQSYPRHVKGALTGRLNGSDVALYLPAAGMAEETARSLREALREALSRIDPMAELSVGAAELEQPCAAPAALALADSALAQAEHDGPFAVALAGARPVLGEREWQQRLDAALQGSGARLAEFEVRDAQGSLLHLDCPMHLQLQPGGAFEPAARWLAMAVRCRLIVRADMAAVNLALQAIERDGLPRCVNVAAASLSDDGFVAAMTQALRAQPNPAGALWIDLAEGAALQPARLEEAAAAWRRLGVRVGLEHAGARLRELPRLQELGIDYVKLDGDFVQGVALQPAVRELARGLAMLLHGMQLKVLAEGVTDAADLQTLWTLGFDGATGPALRNRSA